MRHPILAVAALCAAFALTRPAHAEEVVVLAPGPEGEDTSYYSFIPLLVRGQYTTMYAHTAFDEQGLSHHMETFVKFELPPDLLDPGEEVLEAVLIMTYAFSFDHSGNPPPPGGQLAIHEVIEPWSEATLHYANRPAADPPFEVLTDIDAFGSLVFDVTDAVSRWAEGIDPNYGFKLSNPFDNPIGFHSFEADVDPALKAQLVIVLPEPARAVALFAGIALVCALGASRRSHA